MELICILNSIKAPSYFDEDKNITEFIETSLYLMDEYVKNNSIIYFDPHFKEIMVEDILDIWNEQLNKDDDINFDDDFDDDIEELLEITYEIYIDFFYNTNHQNNEIVEKHSEPKTIIENKKITNKIEELKKRKQPAQRTAEWYMFRNNLITASDAHKVFKSQATLNELIFKKCEQYKINNIELTDTIDNDVKKIVITESKLVNINSSLHWGQKYEPLSVMIYEKENNTKIGEFGCMQHPKYLFLGASPDGINVDERSKKYGIMLEIKNVVSRVIDGIPKREYWIQMQLQMEVCDLDECDFLETKFIEYEDIEKYQEDSPEGEKSYSETIDKKIKGIIIYFTKPDGSPYYVYKSLDCIKEIEIKKWEKEMQELYESAPFNYEFVKYIYWKLEVISCVIVKRDKYWFENNIKLIENAWNIIENERINGYAHRASKKKVPIPMGCLLHLNKIG